MSLSTKFLIVLGINVLTGTVCAVLSYHPELFSSSWICGAIAGGSSFWAVYSEN